MDRRRFPTTNDALKLFFPGQKISLKPLNNDTEINFTICKLSMPVTKSVVVLAKPDSGDPEQVVIKIYDPRYLDERHFDIYSYKWNLATEQAAAIERTKNPDLSDEDLMDIMGAHRRKDLRGEERATHDLFWEEHFYRVVMGQYESESTAYERLKDLQGSAIPRLIMAGRFLPPDERAFDRLPLFLNICLRSAFMMSLLMRSLPPSASKCSQPSGASLRMASSTMTSR